MTPHLLFLHKQQTTTNKLPSKDIGNVIMETLNVSVNVVGEMMLLRKCHKSRDFGILGFSGCFIMKTEEKGWKKITVTSFDDFSSYAIFNLVSHFLFIFQMKFVIFYPLMMFLCVHPPANLITIFFSTHWKANLVCHFFYSTRENNFVKGKLVFYGLCGSLREFWKRFVESFVEENCRNGLKFLAEIRLSLGKKFRLKFENF